MISPAGLSLGDKPCRIDIVINPTELGPAGWIM